MTEYFQPYDGGEKTKKHKIQRFKRVPLRIIIPNIITLTALCVGLTAMRMAIEERFEMALIALIFAALLDALDGRIARLLKSTSRFGAELDSLTDFVNFGVAPAIILYSWLLNKLGSLGWIAVLLFAISTVLRLARFNVALDIDSKKAPFKQNYFVGVPAPAGAILALLPIYVTFLYPPLLSWDIFALFCAFFTILIGLLMVSSLPTYSGKKITAYIPRDLVLPLFVAAIAFIALLASFTWQVMIIGCCIYLMCLPLGWITYKKAESKAQKENDEKELEEDIVL